MATVKLRASTIPSAFEDVESELVGKVVVLSDGKAGTVENVWLDELHGVRLSIKGHDGKKPISTMKFEQGSPKRLANRSVYLAQDTATTKCQAVGSLLVTSMAHPGHACVELNQMHPVFSGSSLSALDTRQK